MSDDALPDLDALETWAKAASPGPWHVSALDRVAGKHLIARCDAGYAPPEEERATAAFIAAANPSAVLALILEVRRLRGNMEKALAHVR